MDELTSSIKMLNLAFTNTFYNNGINMNLNDIWKDSDYLNWFTLDIKEDTLK